MDYRLCRCAGLGHLTGVSDKLSCSLRLRLGGRVNKRQRFGIVNGIANCLILALSGGNRTLTRSG